MNFNIDQFNQVRINILLCYKDYVQDVLETGRAAIGKDEETWVIVSSDEQYIGSIIRDDFSLIENAITDADKKVISVLVEDVISELDKNNAYVLFAQHCEYHSDYRDVLPQYAYFFNTAKVDEVFTKIIANSTKHKEDTDEEDIDE
jgi:hypothetical protein